MSEVQAEPKRLYKSTMPFCNVTLPNGHTLHFKFGKFATDNPDYIEYLDHNIARNSYAGMIYIDPNARTITAEEENPMLALRAKHYAEFLAEQQARLNPENDMGTSEQGKLNAASSSDIAPVTAGGDATARLLAMLPAGSAK